MEKMDNKEKMGDVAYDSNGSQDHDFEAAVPEEGKLARSLQGRHMQMIAIGMPFSREAGSPQN